MNMSIPAHHTSMIEFYSVENRIDVDVYVYDSRCTIFPLLQTVCCLSAFENIMSAMYLSLRSCCMHRSILLMQHLGMRQLSVDRRRAPEQQARRRVGVAHQRHTTAAPVRRGRGHAGRKRSTAHRLKTRDPLRVPWLVRGILSCVRVA